MGVRLRCETIMSIEVMGISELYIKTFSDSGSASGCAWLAVTMVCRLSVGTAVIAVPQFLQS